MTILEWHVFLQNFKLFRENNEWNIFGKWKIHSETIIVEIESHFILYPDDVVLVYEIDQNNFKINLTYSNLEGNIAHNCNKIYWADGEVWLKLPVVNWFIFFLIIWKSSQIGKKRWKKNWRSQKNNLGREKYGLGKKNPFIFFFFEKKQKKVREKKIV